jgi:glycosyltransferase involved in cell wall biosynthesis
LTTRSATAPEVSIVVPMLNECESVERLWDELSTLAADWDFPVEFIFIDDGSYDMTLEILRRITAGDDRVTIIQFSRRFGQTAALGAGFRHACGRVIVPMDADLQNDPADIPMLVATLDEDGGYDVVSGWRKNRKDALVLRKLPSRLANRLIARLTRTKINDFGCTLKAYRAEILDGLHLYGEMHRFLPALCQWQGARITERVVNHRARTAGTSKYGIIRTLKVLLDLTTVKFLGDYLTKPMYFFAKVGAVFFAMSALIAFVAVLQKFGVLYTPPEGGPDFLNLNRNFLVSVSLTMFMTTVMILLVGVLSELLVRIYHESQDLRPYRVRATFRQGESAGPSNPDTDPHTDTEAPDQPSTEDAA